MALILRATKGSPLTHNELDDNFTYLDGKSPFSPISSKAVNYTITSSDGIVIVDATSGDITITLPTAASSYDSGVGSIFTIKRSADDSSGNTLTVDADGSETIDGDLTKTLSAGSAMQIISNGSNWYII